MKSRFQPNNAGLRAMIQGDEVRHLLHQRGEIGRAFAERIAPVDSGDYRDSLKVVDNGRGGPHGRTDRARVDLVADIAYAASLEFGGKYNRQPRHILGSAIDLIEQG